MATATLKQLVLPAQEGEGWDLDKIETVAGHRSMGAFFDAAVERFDENVALRYRDREKQRWVDIDWQRFRKLAHEIAAALVDLGIEHGDRVAVLSNTRYEWTLCDLAIMSIGAVTVPIYQSNMAHEVAYVLEHSGARLVFCEDREQVAKVLEAWGELPDLGYAVLFEGKVRDEDGKIRSFAKLRERGREVLTAQPSVVDDRVAKVRPQDMATIVYTSGTTGPPKGAVLTHTNLLFEPHALRSALSVDEHDETLLFLPQAHIFGRVGMLCALEFGYTVSFAESIEKAIDNMAEIRPTFVFSVPRVYEKVYEKVMGGVKRGSRFKRELFAFAIAVGSAVSRARQAGRRIPPHLYFSYQAADLLVFRTLKKTFGGKLRFFISGGAPLAREIAEFLHAADILVLEAYGLTENVAGFNANRIDDYRFGTVGPPLDGVEQKIADDGEILMRGLNVFQGYYRNPEATAEAIDAEGWFHTGDIGEFDDKGFLRITDRKKDLIVTAGGKNIAPQNLENLFKTEPFISQAMVYGDKRKYLTAIVTVNPEELERLAQDNEWEYEELSEIVHRPEVYQKMERAIARKNKQLASYETIKKFAIVHPDFEVGVELTPSLKVKRKVTIQKYQHLLDALYDDQAPAADRAAATKPGNGEPPRQKAAGDAAGGAP